MIAAALQITGYSALALFAAGTLMCACGPAERAGAPSEERTAGARDLGLFLLAWAVAFGGTWLVLVLEGA